MIYYSNGQTKAVSKRIKVESDIIDKQQLARVNQNPVKDKVRTHTPSTEMPFFDKKRIKHYKL